MLFAIDIGNTNLVFGIFVEDQLEHTWRISTRADRTSEEYSVLLRTLFEMNRVSPSSIDGIVISSVVPPLNEQIKRLASTFFRAKPYFLEPSRQDWVPVRYDPVSEVGADRIVNAGAAFHLYGGPAVVVDFGTATTFDAISENGEYLGGAIAPGVGISSEALFARTSRLPRIEIRKPPKVVGQTTVASMQSGIFFGYVGLVEGILARLREEIRAKHVIATGGYSALLGPECHGVDVVEEDLTMHGLRLFYDYLTSSGQKLL